MRRYSFWSLPSQFAAGLLAILPVYAAAQSQSLCAFYIGTSSFTRVVVAGQTNPINVTGTFGANAIGPNTWECSPERESITFSAFVEPGRIPLGSIQLWLKPRTSALSYSFTGNANFVLPALTVGDHLITLEGFNGNISESFLRFTVRQTIDPALETQKALQAALDLLLSDE